MAKDRMPNIIIFMMDTQGARNLSCYGYRRKTTPNIDRIAEEGTLFERHFVTAPWTLPVHSSLFTGRYESGHGAGAQHEGLEPGLPSLPEVLTRNGYRTVALCNNNWAISDDQWNPGKGFEEIIHYGRGDIPPEPPFIHDSELGNDSGSMKLVGVAKRWIQENVLGQDKPFFMFAHNGAPHDAYLPPEPFRSQFLLEGVSYEDAVARKGNQVDSTIGNKALTFEDWEIQRSLYDGETACLDHRIGLFVEVLRDFGLYDDMLFIITGDHGDSQGQHVRYSYHSQNGVYDAVAHTPLVARMPGVFPTGRRVDELVQIVDIFPMILDLLELNEPEAQKSIQGINLMESLEGAIREFVVIEAQTPIHVLRRAWVNDPDYDPRWAFAALKAARTKQYKYVWHATGEDKLYDVLNDPDERWNIIDRKPEVARELQEKLEKFLMSIEQRYYMDMRRPGRRSSESETKALRRLAAWGLYRPGIVPSWEEGK
jgi:arylsulfatase A-like enzyme